MILDENKEEIDKGMEELVMEMKRKLIKEKKMKELMVKK